jgi:hypothetical protein
MKRDIVARLALFALSFYAFAVIVNAQNGAPNASVSAATDRQLLDMDRTLLVSLEKGEAADLAKVADPDLSWTDPRGHLRMGVDIRHAIASGAIKPVVGAGTDAEVILHRYGQQVAVVQRHKDKNHSQHVWAERAGIWRLLNVAEIIEYAKVPYGGTTINASCTNPCQIVPFVGANAEQQAVIASWQEQQTGPEGWLRRVSEDNVAFSTNGTSTRADRIAVMNQEKASGASVASAPLVWARIWDFQGGAVMLSIQQGNNAKAFWASRAFVNKNGYWQMTESFQTIIQDSQAMSPMPAK